MSIILLLLNVLIYALIAVLVLEIIFLIVALFFPVPPKIRQLLYAIVGVMLIIMIVQALIGSGGQPILPPLIRPR